ncbi:hypothetical protein A2U01_0117964, partial [Trifolium medium]|nr:hypothetical protein [Trifolium medium]
MMHAECGVHGQAELDMLKVELMVKLSYNVEGGAHSEIELHMLKVELMVKLSQNLE